MNTKLKHLLSVITVALFFVFAIASSEDKTVPETDTPVHNVTAKQVFDDFAQNEVAAKEKYGQKVIAVRGIIASIESSGDGAVVLLNDGNSENVGVRCHFNKDQTASTAGLKKGEPAKIIGMGSGSLVIDYDLRSCRMGTLGAE